ncbi:RtcB family protein [Macrococcus equi]|uniref:RtcB family protein n=1 Tax=Macrococcus equi TaxID=3395462 RepID=UPI0039BE7167
MINVNGKYTNAIIMTDNIEEAALNRVQNMTNLDFLADTKIVMMPDVHEGKGCAIGTSIKMSKDKAMIPPAFIGVDIGCGMMSYPLGIIENINFPELDQYISEHISTYSRKDGLNHPTYNCLSKEIKDKILCNLTQIKNRLLFQDVEMLHLINSVGTLGGGNHFVEIGKNSEGLYYLTIHSGSRFLGAKIEKYYLNIAVDQHKNIDVAPIIDILKAQDKHFAIQPMIQFVKELNQSNQYDAEVSYLKDNHLSNYINDMTAACLFAETSRLMMTAIILNYFKIKVDERKIINSPHNFIEIREDDYIIRKGACDASLGRDVIIPINMRDGIIIGKGKGNTEWNNSAPHGAGRVLSRTKAKQTLNLQTFEEQMNGIYSSTVVEDTLDEAPDAYKPIEEIINNIHDTVEILDIIKPVYNHKGIETPKWWQKKK